MISSIFVEILEYQICQLSDKLFKVSQFFLAAVNILPNSPNLPKYGYFNYLGSKLWTVQNVQPLAWIVRQLELLIKEIYINMAA